MNLSYNLLFQYITSKALKHKLLEMLEKASKLSEDEDYDQALKYYQNILQIYSNNVTSIIDYGVTLQNLGHLRQALKMYDRVLANQPKNMNAIINKGTVLHTLRKYPEAISCYNAALKIDKKNTMAIAYKGLSLGEMGHIQLSMKYFKKALSIDNDYELAQISLDTANDIVK